MQLTFNTKVLLASFVAAGKAVSGKNADPVLDNILVEADGEKVTFTGSNGSDSVIITVPLTEETPAAVVHEGGRVCLPPSVMIPLLESIDNESVKLILKNNTIQVDYDLGQASLPAIAAADYPAVLSNEAPFYEVDIPASALRAGIAATNYAAGGDDLRPQLQTVLFDFHKDGLTLVSSDARRLVSYDIPEAKTENPETVLIGYKISNLLKNNIPADAETVHLAVVGNTAVFTAGDYTLITREVTGKFPDWRRVVPKGNPFRLTADRKALVAVLKRVLVCADHGSAQVVFEPKGDLVGGTLDLTTQDIGFAVGAKDTLPVEYSGEPITIGFRGEDLLEMLGKMECDNVVMEIAKPNTTVLLRPADDGREAFPETGVIMPIVVTNK